MQLGLRVAQRLANWDERTASVVQRGAAGALSVLDKEYETLFTKTYVAYDANRQKFVPIQGHIYQVARPFQHLRSGVQGIGLLMSGRNITGPAFRGVADGRLTVDQARAMVGIRAAESAANIAGAKWGAELGALAGLGLCGPGAPVCSAAGGAIGAMTFGTLSAWGTRYVGNRALDYLEVPTE